MLTKTTAQYAFHDIALHCDIYEDEAPSVTTPVVLYFHPGSLTGGTRELIPPWLVQACFQRQWSLISASYRFLPQVAPQGLVDDALTAYTFARAWRTQDRQVIVIGASAGFFMANLICHHSKDIPLPIALLCITGVPTFQHEFYSSSNLTSPTPIHREEVSHWLEGPLVAGDLPEGEPEFSLEMLLSNGSRNPSYVSAEHQDISEVGLQRWDLYDYYVYTNAYPAMLAGIDPGFHVSKSLRQDWPYTIFLQGGADPYLPLNIAEQAVNVIGTSKASLIVSQGQPHLFESATYMEDEGEGAGAVRAALEKLDEIIRAKAD